MKIKCSRLELHYSFRQKDIVHNEITQNKNINKGKHENKIGVVWNLSGAAQLKTLTLLMHSA